MVNNLDFKRLIDANLLQYKKTNPWVKVKVAIGRCLSYIRTGDQFKFYTVLSDEHTYIIITSYCVPKLDVRLDSMYCDKWRKMSCHNVNLEWTMSNVELVHAIEIYYKLFRFQVD